MIGSRSHLSNKGNTDLLYRISWKKLLIVQAAIQGGGGCLNIAIAITIMTSKIKKKNECKQKFTVSVKLIHWKVRIIHSHKKQKITSRSWQFYYRNIGKWWQKMIFWCRLFYLCLFLCVFFSQVWAFNTPWLSSNKQMEWCELIISFI